MFLYISFLVYCSSLKQGTDALISDLERRLAENTLEEPLNTQWQEKRDEPLDHDEDFELLKALRTELDRRRLRYIRTLSGEATVIFIVASNINGGHLIKKRICSNRSKFFPLREDPFLRRLCLKVSNQVVTKIVSFR